ncbi:MAG: hypothetical protein ACYCVH_11870 [Ignavibacteriaceae bacterium]
MFSKKLLFIFFISLSAFVFVYPQNDQDSTSIIDKGREHHNQPRFQFDFFHHDFDVQGSPTIALDYGFSKMS